jgi:hypothetical protein
MHKCDGQSRGFEFSVAHSFGAPHLAGLRPATDSGPIDSLSGDFAEGLTPDWEAAWIDLGGEG